MDAARASGRSHAHEAALGGPGGRLRDGGQGAEGLELESEFILIVFLCQVLECLSIVEEVLEHPQLAKLEVGDPFEPLDDIEAGVFCSNAPLI